MRKIEVNINLTKWHLIPFRHLDNSGFTWLCTCYRMSLGIRNWETLEVGTNKIVRMSDIIKSMQSVDDTIGEGVLRSIHGEWMDVAREEESEAVMAMLGTFD
jgi:hypothetical protein